MVKISQTSFLHSFRTTKKENCSRMEFIETLELWNYNQKQKLSVLPLLESKEKVKQ
jgi:hypothetical protein